MADKALLEELKQARAEIIADLRAAVDHLESDKKDMVAKFWLAQTLLGPRARKQNELAYFFGQADYLIHPQQMLTSESLLALAKRHLEYLVQVPYDTVVFVKGHIDYIDTDGGLPCVAVCSDNPAAELIMRQITAGGKNA